MELFKPGRVYDFMGQRKFWITLSLALVVISTILVFVPGANYGTDFRGGTEVELAFKQDIEASKVRQTVEDIGFKSPDVVQVVDPNSKNHFMIRVPDVSVLDDATRARVKAALCLTEDSAAPVADEAACPKDARATEVKFSPGGDKIFTRYDVPPSLATVKKQVQTVGGTVALRGGTGENPLLVNARDNHVEIQLESKGDQLMNGLRRTLGDEVVPEQPLLVEWVGPKAGKQLRDSARNSVAIAIVFIMLYLAFRFDLRFAPGVVIACVHDAMVVLGVFVVLRKEVTLSTIAAILTIVGYSMNDTIVVYDRIRENLLKFKGKPFAHIINLSVSETLSRTILTSGATALSMIAFLVWGTGIIKDFAFAVLVGIVAGTYSSIYVAAPLTEWIDRQMKERSRAARRKNRLPAGGSPAKA
jgi:preprotein translocase subunit SecF